MLLGAALAGNPLGNCQNGTAVSTVAQSANGRCKYPTNLVANYAYASVSESFFNRGAECGACFELTGPLGTTTVIVTDACPASSDPKCNVPASTPHFIINQASYSAIVNPTNNEQITDLGWRRVTCNVPDNSVVQMTTNVAGTISQAYFNVIFTNSRLQVSAVTITSASGETQNDLTRQGGDTEGSAVWEWNHVDTDKFLDFPATITIQGATDQVLSIQVNNSIISSTASRNRATLSFSEQFRDVVGTGAAVCPMAAATTVIYSNGKIGSGWNDDQSFNTLIIANDTTRPVAGATYNFVSQASPYGGAQFKRIGGFQTNYFTNLTFVASSDNTCTLYVYFGSGNDTRGVTITTTTTNQVFSFNLANDFKANPFEYYLVFQNNQNGYCHTYLSEIMFYVNATSPLANVPLVTTTGYQFNVSGTTGPIVVVDTTATISSQTTGGGASSSAGTTGGASGTGASTDNGAVTQTTSTSDATGALSVFAVAAVTAAALLF